jgi:ABC-type polysaccharide/polyol phosphate transport system ATPase subunit
MIPAIQFQHVSKKFRLNLSRPRSFIDVVVNRRLRTDANEFWALKDISLDIQPGETVGLIGSNGAGKSTLLKLITRILEPSSGTVTAYGRVASLLELGAGFHPDLSGRENIFLNASILGIPRQVVKRQMDSIVDFADIGPFIDVPVRNYSSGMAMRLGFAITTTLEPEILLIDEILAVGDQSFQRKCLERLDTLRTQGMTTLFVSHSLDQVRRLCPRAIWMSHGQVYADGDADPVIGAYLDVASPSNIGRHMPPRQVEGDNTNRWGTYQAEITAVELLDEHDQPRQVFACGGFFRVRMHYQTQVPVVEPAFGLAIYRGDGLHLNGPNSVIEGVHIPRIDGHGHVDYNVEHLPLAVGQYELSVAIYNRDSTIAHDHHQRLYRFEVQDRRSAREDGIVHLPATWRHVSGDQ